MNKAHGITKENLLASLPAVLANDDNMAALASAVAEVLAARVGEIERVSIYSQIDRLPNELLDILANDFKVDWWDANYTLEEKRRTLKDSWNVHRRLGTKAAVVLAISAIYPDTQVSEWWEYGGKPYHFKLLIDATYEDVNPVRHQRVIDRVAFYKNLRSVLDEVEYYDAGVCSGTGEDERQETPDRTGRIQYVCRFTPLCRVWRCINIKEDTHQRPT